MLDHIERSYLYKFGYEEYRDHFTPDEEREIRARIVEVTRPRTVWNILEELRHHCDEAIDLLICAGAREDEIGYDVSMLNHAHEIRFRDEWIIRLTRGYGRTGAWQVDKRRDVADFVKLQHAVEAALLKIDDKLTDNRLGYHRIRVAVALELGVPLADVHLDTRTVGIHIHTWVKWGGASVNL